MGCGVGGVVLLGVVIVEGHAVMCCRAAEFAPAAILFLYGGDSVFAFVTSETQTRKLVENYWASRSIKDNVAQCGMASGGAAISVSVSLFSFPLFPYFFISLFILYIYLFIYLYLKTFSVALNI
jgi:hypothetical protein